jgi:hypothetical protein
VTVVVPSGKVAGALLTTLATEQLSAVTGVPKTTPVAVQLALAFTVTLEGAVIVGKMLSTIVAVMDENTTLFPGSEPKTKTVF